MKKVRTRFAPSPTGYMHIGNLRTALYEYLVAKKDNGDFILRIEDTDQNRLVEGSVDIIYDTLNQVGLHYDEGPDRPGDFGPYVQSERLPMYKKYADELVEKGGAHVCFCDESVIQAQRDAAEAAGVPFKFQDPCHHLSIEDVNDRMANEAYVIRQTIQPGASTVFHDEVYGDIEVDREILDEQVLLKSDGFPTYNFANVIDDHQMEISHVVRGNEYLSSTPKYNLIYESFGWEKPKYVHLPPVMKDEQHKLSKRNGDASFQDLVSKGYLPEAILNYIALLGWSPETNQEIYTLEELTKVFSVARISKSPAIFDIDKLKWMNGMYLRAMSLDQFHAICLPYYKDAIKRECDLKEVSKILQQRLTILSEIPEMVDFIDTLADYDVTMFYHPKMKTNREISILALEESLNVYSTIENWNSVDEIHQKLSETPARLGVKNGQFYWPIRTAVTGKQFTPGGALEIPYILGKDETIRRTHIGLEKLRQAME
ncbi:MAG: glutamate--tRNA ligase [Firmicutes bacterium HGW-Firmicutes-10]|jgi:glutamyl-tRNA synthetase|nr:MAG: glutamate--tRNA ligase [Firmicutes bacterium HGW-Firmicutes-10]